MSAVSFIQPGPFVLEDLLWRFVGNLDLGIFSSPNNWMLLVALRRLRISWKCKQANYQMWLRWTKFCYLRGQFESNKSSVKPENLNAHWHCDGWITYHLVIKLLLKMIKSCANDISLNSVETMMTGCLLMSKRNSCDTAFSFMWLKWKKLNQARVQDLQKRIISSMYKPTPADHCCSLH